MSQPQSTIHIRCRCLQIPPGKPVGLYITPGSGMAQLCWLGVDNDACVDEYRWGRLLLCQLTVWVVGRDSYKATTCGLLLPRTHRRRVGAVRVDSQFRAQTGDAPISKGGCANISRLEDGVRYVFSVVPYTSAFGEGPAAQQESFVGTSEEARSGWTCTRQPSCRPNTVSLCSMVGCEAMTRGLGSCKGPAMFDIDHLHRKVSRCG